MLAPASTQIVVPDVIGTFIASTISLKKKGTCTFRTLPATRRPRAPSTRSLVLKESRGHIFSASFRMIRQSVKAWLFSPSEVVGISVCKLEPALVVWEEGERWGDVCNWFVRVGENKWVEEDNWETGGYRMNLGTSEVGRETWGWFLFLSVNTLALRLGCVVLRWNGLRGWNKLPISSSSVGTFLANTKREGPAAHAKPKQCVEEEINMSRQKLSFLVSLTLDSIHRSCHNRNAVSSYQISWKASGTPSAQNLRRLC